MVLAGTVGKDHALIRRLRTLTFGLLTPFYFIRAGSLVSLPALVAAPAAFLILLGAKMATKVAGVYPATRALRSPRRKSMYTTLLMSSGTARARNSFRGRNEEKPMTCRTPTSGLSLVHAPSGGFSLACAGNCRRRRMRYAAGITNNDKSGAVIMPPIIGAAIRCMTSEPAP